MSVVIRHDLAICTSVSAQENVSCANGYMQVLFEAYSISVQCLQTAPAGADFTTPKSQATAQHDCTLTLLHFFHTISQNTVTTTRPLPGIWPGLGRRRNPSVKHRCNLPHKDPGEDGRRASGAPCSQSESNGIVPSLLIWRCTCIQAQKFLDGTTGWLREEEAI